MENEEKMPTSNLEVVESIESEKHRITVEVPPHTFRQYRKLLETTGMTRTQLVILLIEKGYESILRDVERAA